MESKTKNNWRKPTTADYTILIQFFYFWYAVLIAPSVALLGFSVLIDEDPAYQLGVLLAFTLVVEPIGMLYLANRRQVVHKGLGIAALFSHAIMTLFIWAIAVEAFGVNLDERFPWWVAAIMLVLIVKELFIGAIVVSDQNDASEQLQRSAKKESWAQVSIMLFSAMVYSAFWIAGVNSLSLNPGGVTIGGMLLLMIAFVVMHMSANVVLFLMNEDGKFNTQAFIKTTLSSVAIALVPVILQLFR